MKGVRKWMPFFTISGYISFIVKSVFNWLELEILLKLCSQLRKVLKTKFQ